MSKILQDWTDYDKSLIFSMSDEYFLQQGSDAYSQKTKSFVPNVITNCYPHAYSCAKTFHDNILNYPRDQKLKILEAGAGSGIFARHFLIAAKEFGFLDRIEYLVSDFSKTAIEDIKKNGTLEDFKEGKEYQLLELNLLDLDSCKTIDGKPYQLEDVSLAIFNYVYDALPLKVVRESAKGYEKQQLKFNQSGNSKLLRDLDIEERWQNYSPEEESGLEQKYFKYLEKTPLAAKDIYSYSALAVTDEMLKICNDNGYLFIADFAHDDNPEKFYEIYANTTAHAINDKQISALAEDLGYFNIRSSDQLLTRMLIFKNPNSKKQFVETYQNEYIKKNYTNRFIDLQKAINDIKDTNSHDILKYLIDEFLKIDGYSVNSYLALGKYFEMVKQQNLAKEQYQKAQKLDFLKSYNIEKKLTNLQN